LGHKVCARPGPSSQEHLPPPPPLPPPNNTYSDQGAGGSRDRDSEGVRVGCDEGRAGQKVGVCSNAYGAPRVGARGDSGAHGGAYGAPATATTPTTRSREAVVVA
jgi:hypothetical protein